MQKSKKAMLLSALVFPGAGHLYLKTHFSGLILAGISFLMLVYLADQVMHTAFDIVEKIQTGSAQADMTTLISQANTQPLNPLSLVLMVCWIIGIIDTYRLARKQEN